MTSYSFRPYRDVEPLDGPRKHGDHTKNERVAFVPAAACCTVSMSWMPHEMTHAHDPGREWTTLPYLPQPETPARLSASAPTERVIGPRTRLLSSSHAIKSHASSLSPLRASPPTASDALPPFPLRPILSTRSARDDPRGVRKGRDRVWVADVWLVGALSAVPPRGFVSGGGECEVEGRFRAKREYRRHRQRVSKAVVGRLRVSLY